MKTEAKYIIKMGRLFWTGASGRWTCNTNEAMTYTKDQAEFSAKVMWPRYMRVIRAVEYQAL